MVAACPHWRRRRIPVWLPPLAALALLGCPLPPGPTTSRLQVQRASAVVSSYDFGKGIVGVPGAVVTFTIVNEGSATVNLGDISVIRITGTNAAEFSASALGSTVLGPGMSTTFDLAFDPAAPATSQARTATVTINPVSGGSSVAFSVAGTGIDFGVEQSGVVVSNWDFGTCTAGVGTPVTFTIHNQGSTQIDLAAVQLTGSTDFSASTPSPSPVAAGDTASFTITFAPSSPGTPLTSTVTVASVGGLPSYSFTVQGMGTSGQFELRESDNVTPVTNGTLIDFGTVMNGQLSPDKTYQIDNLSTGSDDLIVTSSLSDLTAFTCSLAAGSHVAPVASLSFTIQAGKKLVLPSGTYNATLTISTSDVGHPTFTLYLTVVVT